MFSAICVTCKNVFCSIYKKQKFCSRPCVFKFMKGKPPSNAGIRRSREARLNMSLSRMAEKHHRWQGGRKIKGGYVCIYSPSHPFSDQKRYVKEHRLIMEKHLGRILDRSEIVHHVNHDRQDNRIENLQVMSNSEHIRLHKKGSTHSKESRIKISKAAKGRPAWNKGKKLSLKHRINLSISHMKIK